jgi:phage N-6-adenine-methyltransferase
MVSKTEVGTQRLAALEAVIERGLQTFVEVGNALLEIRDSRLYRESHATFEEYCRERWGWSRQRANQLIDAAGVMQNLTTMVVTPKTERQTRELIGLESELQREVWQAAVRLSKTGQPTAREIGGVIARLKTWDRQDQDNPYRMEVHFSSKSPEWYTPRGIIGHVIQVLGQIDLDPCSNSVKSPNVPAKLHFTQEDDGLSKKWGGRVYMNPPYGRVINAWVEKLCTEYQAGNVTEAVALVPARVDTEWFSRLGRLEGVRLCVIRGRLKFSEHKTSAPFPSVVIYIGHRIGAFNYVFRNMGDILRWEPDACEPEV